jgi:two-component system nitrate/nitrite response regulator NarL
MTDPGILSQLLRARSERVVAGGRLAIAAFIAGAITLDPTQPTSLPWVTHTILVLYGAIAAMLLYLQRRNGPSSVRFNMPPPNGLMLLQNIRRKDIASKSVLLTSSLSSDDLAQALKLGVGGIVLKESAARLLVRCLESVFRGEQWLDPELTRRLVGLNGSAQKQDGRPPSGLTPRELEVLRLAAKGNRNKEIGRALDITEGTVKMYLHSVYQKLEVTNRMEMVNSARMLNLL